MTKSSTSQFDITNKKSFDIVIFMLQFSYQLKLKIKLNRLLFKIEY